MRPWPIALLLLAGCGGADDQAGNNAAAPGPAAEAPDGGAKGAAPTAIGSGRLTGLYEGGSGERRDQLCIVDKGSGDAQFGIIVWGEGLNSCSGAGQVAREGQGLRLRMAGDSQCEIRASIDGAAVVLPAEVPAGCAYYCAASGARFTGARLTRSGTTDVDALKARDIVGDPLCEPREP